MREQLLRLKELQDLDITLRKLWQEHAQAMRAESVGQLYNRVNELRREIARLEKDYKDLHLQYNRSDMMLTTLRAQKQQMEIGLYNDTLHSRELLQMQTRAGQMQVQIMQLEEEMMVIMQAQEDIQTALAVLENELGGSKTELASQRRSNADSMVQLAMQIKELEALRMAVTSVIDQEILKNYDDLCRKKGTGVALLKGEICSGCHVGVPSFMLSKVEAGKTAVYCESCDRLLVPGG